MRGSTMNISVLGIDIAKNIFQLHGYPQGVFLEREGKSSLWYTKNHQKTVLTSIKFQLFER